MKITTLFVRNYKSLQCVNLESCSDLNIIIGKNNSGKSNVLSAISLVIEHLNAGLLTSEWRGSSRPVDQIYNRTEDTDIQIGIEFKISAEMRDRILDLISSEVEGIEYAIENAKREDLLTVILDGIMVKSKLSQYLKEISFGGMVADNGKITSTGYKIYYIPDAVAPEIIATDRDHAKLARDIESLDRVLPEVNARAPWRIAAREKEENRYWLRRMTDSMTRETYRKLLSAIQESEDASEFAGKFDRIKFGVQSQIDEILARPLSQTMQAFSGTVRRTPDYIKPVLKLLGSVELLHFRESRLPVGAEEADKLLRLKTTRGGPEQLSALQSVVKALLGVKVDAFSADVSEDNDPFVPRGSQRQAEMDIDEFLVEANGAGIREALRIVLDLELRRPNIALIEEPEVHLHPGLEKAVHHYLVQKGLEVQIFLATHSTNFLDVASKQNIYIIKKTSPSGSVVERAISDDDILQIPGEIGLKPSSVFMFDKLVFVEGPSDEEVLTEFAEKLEIDIGSRSVGYVRMGGSSNMTYFSSDATLNLLSRRQVPMIFILDSDERNEEEIQKIQDRIGARATFHSLKKRELENYLLSADAIQKLIAEKRASTRERDAPLPGLDDIAAKIRDVAMALKERFVELKINRELLKPVYIERMPGSTSLEKIRSAADSLRERMSAFEEAAAKIESEAAPDWQRLCLERASGSEILKGVLKEFGLTYQKERDALRLAKHMRREEVDREIALLLRSLHAL